MESWKSILFTWNIQRHERDAVLVNRAKLVYTIDVKIPLVLSSLIGGTSVPQHHVALLWHPRQVSLYMRVCTNSIYKHWLCICISACDKLCIICTHDYSRAALWYTLGLTPFLMNSRDILQNSFTTKTDNERGRGIVILIDREFCTLANLPSLSTLVKKLRCSLCSSESTSNIFTSCCLSL